MKTSPKKKRTAPKKPERKQESKIEKKPMSNPTPRPAHNSNFKIRPLADRVIIKEDLESKEQMTASGIIIPITAQEEKNGKRGVVVAVGPGATDDGVTTPIDLEVGDKVLFQWGDKIKVEGEEYYIVKESEILAVIK